MQEEESSELNWSRTTGCGGWWDCSSISPAPSHPDAKINSREGKVLYGEGSWHRQCPRHQECCLESELTWWKYLLFDFKGEDLQDLRTLSPRKDSPKAKTRKEICLLFFIFTLTKLKSVIFCYVSSVKKQLGVWSQLRPQPDFFLLRLLDDINTNQRKYCTFLGNVRLV